MKTPFKRRQSWWLALSLSLIAYVSLLILAQARNYYVISPDGVAYTRIGSYYASGQLDLAISSTWGPLFSWLIAAFSLILPTPLMAARAALGLSVLLFVGASLRLFRVLTLPVIATAALLPVALFGLEHSRLIGADLLLGAVFVAAASELLHRDWSSSVARQITAGGLLGLAYLTKPSAIAQGALLLTGLACLHIVRGDQQLRRGLRALVTSAAIFVLIMGSWIGLLSVTVSEMTVSSSGTAAHAIVGPNDVQRDHPYQHRLHVPPAGRISVNEDAARYMEYNDWSPFESPAYALHQLEVIWRNSNLISGILSGFDYLRLGFFCVIAAFLFHAPWFQNIRRQSWRWLLIPVIAVSAPYLPFYAADERYYYPVFPFLLAATIWFVHQIFARHHGATSRLPRAVAIGILLASFIIPSLVGLKEVYVTGDAESAGRAAHVTR